MASEAEASQTARARVGEGMKDARESDDDSSSSSSESGSSTEEEASSTEVPPPDSIIVGKQIRQHARELLGDADTVDSSDDNNTIRPTKQSNINYQSYHDDVPSTRVSSASHFTNRDGTTSVTTPWASTSSDYGNNNNDDGMSMTDIATMAFSCVASCLTEGYRAASNYYGTYYQQHQQEQYPGTRMMSGVQSYYQQVASYHNEAYSHSNNNNYRANMNNSYNDVQPSKNGYSDLYQNEISGTEVMERGNTSSISNEKSSRQTPGEQTSRKEEWETVQVPSSYQGGRVGGRN
ncbi:hypothetical protein ACHAWU_006353 [Discostella pseudostelligera]|uniref:Uncharacterized protein n=1 Tax=Discostella pseudostelligera TaxID=259834 RepID=A0ABD3M029_9STRA